MENNNNNVLANLPALTRLVIATNGISGVSFASVVYTNAQNEVQKSLINIGVSYETAKQKDIEFLENLDLATVKGFDLELLTVAKDELLEGLKNPNEARSAGQINAYTRINNGMKYHNETGELYILGMVVSKTVLVEGEKKTVKSAPKTIAKNAIRKLLKSTQYRQYKVNNTATAKLKGDTMEFEG